MNQNQIQHNNNNKVRIEYFDLLKGLAIFIVVMGHVITMCIRDLDSSFIFKVIKEIHMPVFFFISGYLTYKIGYKSPDLWKRFKQLIIPFLTVSALWIWYFPHSGLKSPISSTLEGMYSSVWKDGYWFTLCLFELFIVYFPLSKLFSKISNIAIQISITIAIYVTLLILKIKFTTDTSDFIGLTMLSTFYPVFMLGIFAHRFNDIYRTLTSGGNWFVVGLLLFIPNWYYISYPWDMPFVPSWYSYIASPVEHLGLMIIVITLITPWSHKEFSVNKTPSIVARYFCYLGKESLAIYLLHYFFLFPLTPLQEPFRHLGLSFIPMGVFSAFVAFFIIAAALSVNYILKQNRWTALLLTGKDMK